jgi:ATP-dependent protease Clp ATPase subunit
MFLELLETADFDVEAAQRGIVFLDGMHRRDAQEELVDLLKVGSSQVKLFPQELRIEIASMLFVCFGTFLELDRLTARRGRHPEQPILEDDLLTLGVLPTFVRRLRAIVRVSPLDELIMTRLVISANLNRWPNDSNNR